MIFLKALLALIFLVTILFFFLGLKSQKGLAPGLINGELAPCPSSPNCVSSEEGTQPEKKVRSLKADLGDAKAAIMATGGTITSESDKYISATYMSKLFKFVDDLEIRKGEDGVTHIRSSSRVGYSDRGMNRKRVIAIRAALKGPTK